MSLTKVINTGIKNSEITGSKINTASSFSFDVLQANTITVANEFYSNSVNSAYNQANTANTLAQAAYDAANNAVDTWVRDAANSASTYANGAFDAANNADQKAVTSGTYANAAYAEANVRATTTYVDNAIANLVNSAPTTLDTLNELSIALNNDPNFATTIATNIGIIGDYSNSAFLQANTPNNVANSASIYANAAFAVANSAAASSIDSFARDVANSAFVQANTTSNVANSASSYANSSFVAANVADQRAVTSGSYANGAFTQANTATTNAATADQKAVTSGVYANAAFTQANTPSQVANSASSYANGAFLQANTSSNVANSASSYANGAFAKANTANTLAQAAYDQANTSGGGGGSGLFNSAINTSVGYAVTSSLSNAVVFSANAIVHSIYLTNISSDSTSNVQVLGDFTPSGTSNVSIFYKIPLPYRSSVEMLKKPQVVKTNDILKLQSFEDDVPASSNAHAIIVYETTTETTYERVGKLVTDAYSNMYTSTSAPSVVESIKLVNQDSSYGNHAITVVLTNSSNTLQGYLTKELILPANSTIELCESPKYMSAGDKFDAWATTTGVVSIFVSAKKIT